MTTSNFESLGPVQRHDPHPRRRVGFRFGAQCIQRFDEHSPNRERPPRARVRRAVQKSIGSLEIDRIDDACRPAQREPRPAQRSGERTGVHAPRAAAQ